MGELKYTPAGTAVREFTLAVPQSFLDRRSMGYFQAMIVGGAAEESRSHLKVGRKLKLRGSLWSRSFKNRQGQKQSETKILVESIEGEIDEKKR